jgi:hypothetical protein
MKPDYEPRVFSSRKMIHLYIFTPNYCWPHPVIQSAADKGKTKPPKLYACIETQKEKKLYFVDN